MVRVLKRVYTPPPIPVFGILHYLRECECAFVRFPTRLEERTSRPQDAQPMAGQ
jgi:hypothetical protein